MPGTQYVTYFDKVTIINSIEPTETIIENFDSPVPQNNWNYANSDRFWIENGPESFYDLCPRYPQYLASHGFSGICTNDGVQYDKTFMDTSIEGWFYPSGTNNYILGLWLRTSNNVDPEGSSTFQIGYFLKLNSNKLSICKYFFGSGTTLATYTLDSYISGRFWHLKFSAIGSTLQGWVSRTDGFTLDPQISISDVSFASGKPGFSTRTNLAIDPMHFSLICGIKIKIYDEIEPVEENNQTSWSSFGNGLFANPIDNPNFIHWIDNSICDGWEVNTNYGKSTDSDDDYSLQALAQPGQDFILTQTITESLKIEPFIGKQVKFAYFFKAQPNDVYTDVGYYEKARAGIKINYIEDGLPQVIETYGYWVHPKLPGWFSVEVLETIPEDTFSFTVIIQGSETPYADGFDTVIDDCSFAIYYLFIDEIVCDGYYTLQIGYGISIYSIVDVDDELMMSISIAFFSNLIVHQGDYYVKDQIAEILEDSDSLSYGRIWVKEFCQLNNLGLDVINKHDQEARANLILAAVGLLLAIIGLVVTICTAGTGTALYAGLCVSLLSVGVGGYAFDTAISGYRQSSDSPDHDTGDTIGAEDRTHAEWRFNAGITKLTTTQHLKLFFPKSTLSSYTLTFNNKVKVNSIQYTFGLTLDLNRIGGDWKIQTPQYLGRIF
ncbi:MAG: hypothetical protein JXA54_13050 [Candidatus Heimdallarchaeota archaeon]|nr:hypothetical protein [Candidatus Heimdallarchaeota archaeon]